jgi:hypothetical protein
VGIGFVRQAFVGLAASLVAATLAFAQPAQTTVNPLVPTAAATHVATLNGANETPPGNSPATGYAWMRFDAATNTLTWTVEYAGLTGPANGAHFHGPGVRGMNSPVVVPLGTAFASPIQGTVVLTPAQATQFLGGRWYLNIHTQRFPNGEIRGQAVAIAP